MGVALFSTTLEPLFYLSLLFPFYVLLGVQVFHEWLGRFYTRIAILTVDALILCMIYGSTKDAWPRR